MDVAHMTSRPVPEPHMRAIGLNSPARRPTAAPQETQVHTGFGELETFPAEFSTRISSYIHPHVRSIQPDRKTSTSKNHPKPPYSTYLLYLHLASDHTYLPYIYIYPN